MPVCRCFHTGQEHKLPQPIKAHVPGFQRMARCEGCCCPCMRFRLLVANAGVTA